LNGKRAVQPPRQPKRRTSGVLIHHLLNIITGMNKDFGLQPTRVEA